MKAILLLGILLLAAILRFYQLPDMMMFIGDQGWFYLAARDMLLTGQIPLVGMPSSHPWLHQGAFWTYMLSSIFALTQFNPIAPGYFVAGLGVVTVFLIYKIGMQMFSERIGIIAAALYATSPLIVIHERMPYHTSLISLCTLLLVFTLYKWVKGWQYGFPLTIFLLAILYNFQISTIPLLVVFMVFVVYGFFKKQKYFLNTVNKKIFFLSAIAWFIPMLPMLLYDISHGFPQTLKLVLWIGYKFALLFGFPSIHGDKVFQELVPFLPFTIIQLQQLIFLPHAIIGITILIVSIGYLAYIIYKMVRLKKSFQAEHILFTAFIIPFLSYFALKTPSGAYLPMFFPAVILLIATTLNALISKPGPRYVGIIAVILIIASNSYMLFKSNFLMERNGYGPLFKERLEKSKEIVKQAEGMRYNIKAEGLGSQFDSFTMNYEYLTWWLGHGSSDNAQRTFVISENHTTVKVEKK